MLTPAVPLTGEGRAAAAVHLAGTPGWREAAAEGVTLHHKGYLYGRDFAAVAAAFAACDGRADIARLLHDLDGHFALIAVGPAWTVAAVDRCRTIPLYWCEGPGRVEIGAHAPNLAERCGLDDVDAVAARAIAMAGYTIGTDTLYRGLAMLGPGQALFVAADDGPPERLRYHRYEPWAVTESESPELSRRLAEVTLGILSKMADSADGRTIAVPLSAGLDSRLVAAGLKHIGYPNVKCFAYGLPGNYEAAASRKIAAALGFDWRFVPLTPASQRRHFASAERRAYLAQADSLCSSPFSQDLSALRALLDDGFIPPDAVMANGNSGDFISGLHILPALRTPRADRTPAEREDTILDAAIGKHFRLWQDLATPENDGAVRDRLRRVLREEDLAPDDPACNHGIYEFLEFQDRQSKYVISGQRIYEFLGLDWRLPLWDGAYLDFWQGVPLPAKAGQALYRSMLLEENWGGVWQGWDFARTVSPAWLRPVRWAAKAAHAPLGRDRWHRFERRWFGYWMDVMANHAVVPYGRVARDRRGARHAVSWLTEAYLNGKGLGYDGRPL